MSSTHPAFDFEVITPDGATFRGRAASVRLQGKDGSFGILARHAPLVAALETGIGRIELEGGKKEQLALGEGFVEVSQGKVRVLADFCNTKQQIDVARAAESEQRARERLKTRAEHVDHARAEAALRRALVRLTVGRGVEA